MTWHWGTSMVDTALRKFCVFFVSALNKEKDWQLSARQAELFVEGVLPYLKDYSDIGSRQIEEIEVDLDQAKTIICNYYADSYGCKAMIGTLSDHDLELFHKWATLRSTEKKEHHETVGDQVKVPINKLPSTRVGLQKYYAKAYEEIIKAFFFKQHLTLPPKMTIDDFVQDVWIKVLSGLRHFRYKSRIQTFIIQIILNYCSEVIRKPITVDQEKKMVVLTVRGEDEKTIAKCLHLPPKMISNRIDKLLTTTIQRPDALMAMARIEINNARELINAWYAHGIDALDPFDTAQYEKISHKLRIADKRLESLLGLGTTEATYEVSLDEPIDDEEGGITIIDTIPSTDEDPEQKAFKNELRLLVRKAIREAIDHMHFEGKATAEQRKKLYYQYINDFTQKEIAKILGLSTATVNNLIFIMKPIINDYIKQHLSAVYQKDSNSQTLNIMRYDFERITNRVAANIEEIDKLISSAGQNKTEGRRAAITKLWISWVIATLRKYLGDCSYD